MTSPGELILVVAALAVAVVVVARATRATRATRRTGVALLAALLALSGVAAVALGRRPGPVEAPRGQPRSSGQAAYVGSAGCRGCHPGEHASFGRTYHRTMTAAATPVSVLAPMVGGLERRGDEVWATLPDPDAPESAVRSDGAGPAEVTRRVVLTTGSHREQAYWVAGKREGELRLFPSVWLVREKRFVPRRDAFLVPPDAPTPRVRWNSNCIACHAVAGEPRHDPERDAFDSRAAELGIACEACHGPGAEHASKHRDPVVRYMQHATKSADPTIVQPKRLPPDRSAAVCGQCHAYAFPKDENAWWTSGYARSFRAGDALGASRILLDPAELGRSVEIEAAAESLFWPDGTIRVGGREYNGLVASACYARGHGDRQMTCVSCHAMHAGSPSGQIAPDRDGDRQCTQCHAMPEAHAHHAKGSSGAACVACHMPRTTYALFSAIRSHRVERPRADDAKPNACNLCHLDRSRAWTAKWLGAWYGVEAQADPKELQEVPEGARGALAGDAATRVVIADALGRPEARAAAVLPGFAPPLLAELIDDPYSAVRFVAARSLRAQPGYEDVAIDFLAPVDARRKARADVLARAKLAPADAARLAELLAARDARPITIAE